MTLTPGTHLGPYEIVAPLGAGGMGEVYRARDSRLSRDVAIKIVSAHVAIDPDAARRFEGEARAAGQLNHPNVLAIFDIGSHDGCPYIVSELLEGETLRDRLDRGRLPHREAVEYLMQVASGVAAAHDKGIVHRDLKPENLFITRDNRLKILDFGLAKLMRPVSVASDATMALTPFARTEAGVVLGTVGYMSPEQVRGEPVDHHADVFSIGAILYELLTGERAFSRSSAIETMSAILKEDPPELAQGGRALPAGFDRILRRCLEKRAEARWQSVRDLGFALEAIVAAVSSDALREPAPAAASRTPAREVAWVAGALAAGTVVALAVFALWRRESVAPAPAFQRLTFGRGTIWSARFAPDGRPIVYSATWDGRGVELFSTRADGQESRSLAIPGADVAAISPSGEMALLVKPGSFVEWAWKWGTVARASLAGGAPRETLSGVEVADAGPDGASLAVVRAVNGRSRIEFPIGHGLYETADRIGALRVSHRGDLVAFAERPPGITGTWSIATLDASGRKTTIATGSPGDFIDLVWPPRDDEIWFDTRQGGSDGIFAATLTGRTRALARPAVPLQLFDASADGRLLAARAYWRSGILGAGAGAAAEEDLSWLDASELDDVAYDGRSLLVTEFGEGGGIGRGSVYLKRLDGSVPVRLGDGQGFALSPDGGRALAVRRSSPPELVVWPTAAGEPLTLKHAGFSDYTWADWLPDGRHIVFSATESGRRPRCYIQDTESREVHPITPEGTTLVLGQRVVSPDGASIAAIESDGRASLYPIAGGTPRPIAGIEPGDVPLRWSADERSLYVFRKSGPVPRVYLVDLATGRNSPWKDILPSDRTGIVNVWAVHVAPDESSYYYSYMRNLSDLYLIDGLK